MSAHPQSFSTLVADLEFDRNAFRNFYASCQPSTVDYVMFFTPRSGSTWLTSILSGILGNPEEYLNPAFVRNVAMSMQTKDPRELLQMLRRVKKSRNGVFGIQVRNIDVELFNASVFFATFVHAAFINLRRRNILAQAISLYRATETGAFHSVKPDVTRLEPESIDEPKILHWLRHIATIERRNHELLEARKLPRFDIFYEDIILDAQRTIISLAGYIGVEFDGTTLHGGLNETQKMGDGWNLRVERLMRANHAGEIDKVQAARLLDNGGAP